MDMEVSSEPSFNTGIQNSPSSSPFPSVQSMQTNHFTGSGDFPASELTANVVEQVKRIRGRPRKYAVPDGPMPMGMPVAPPSSSASAAQTGVSSGFSLSPPQPTTKKKGKRLGLGKKQQMDALGSSGIGFTPHVIAVKAGEDVSEKIMSFSNSGGTRAICVLSANGAISNVTIHQPGTSGGTATYDGRYEILSLSGSILLDESSEQCSRTGGLSVSLACPDGSVLGGGVAGLLIAATPVQVVVGSFIADRKHREQPSTNLVVLDLAREKPPEPEPLSPISEGTTNEPLKGAHFNPYSLSSNGSNHHNGIISSQGLAAMPWK